MNGQAYQVTAFYDSKADAEAGADILRNNGIASGDIDIIAGREAEQVHEHGSDGGFMDKLSSFFMPEEDRHAYAEGLGRGGYVLRVDVAEKDHQRVVDLLDTDNSVDLDERANAWRAEGWDGGSAGAAADTGTGTTRARARARRHLARARPTTGPSKSPRSSSRSASATRATAACACAATPSRSPSVPR